MANRKHDPRFANEHHQGGENRRGNERAERNSFSGDNASDRRSKQAAAEDWYERNDRRHQAQLQHRVDRGRSVEQYREDIEQPGYGERYGFSGYGRAHYDPDINRGWQENPEVETWREGARFTDREQDYRGARWDRETHGYHNGDGRYHDGDGRAEYSARNDSPRSRENWRTSSYTSRNPESREYPDHPGDSAHEDDNRFGRGGFAGIAPKNYQRSDMRIEEDVCERLTANPYIDPSNIEVKVLQGEAILSGEVADRRMKRLAEDIADETPGVRNVNNQIHIERPRLKSMPLDSDSGRMAPTTQRQPA